MNLVERYTQQLQSPKEKTRENAVHHLGQLGLPMTLDWLAALLHDKSVLVRRKVANVLGQSTEEYAVDLLKQALSDLDDSVYGAASTSLAKIGTQRAVAILIQEVIQNSETRRRIATNKLIRIGKPATEPLIEAYYSSAGTVQAYFLKALGKIGDERAADVFIDALSNPDPEVFWVATAVQRDQKDARAAQPLLHALSHASRFRCSNAAKALACLDVSSIFDSLLEILLDAEQDDKLRAQLIHPLVNTADADLSDPLWKLLGDPQVDASLCRSAFWGLSKIAEPDKVSVFIEMANQQPDAHIFHGGIRNLGHYGDRNVLAQLEHLMMTDGPEYDVRVRLTVEEAIGRLGARLQPPDPICS